MDNINFSSAKEVVDEETGRERTGLERFAGLVLLVCTFLLPIFFIPSVSFPFQQAKAVLLSVSVLLAFCVWVIARLKDSRFVIPQTLMLFSLGFFVVLAALSSLLSGAVSDSFFGQGFEVGTAVSLLIAFALAFLVSILFRAKDQIFLGYLVFFSSFFLVALFQALRLAFGPAFLSLGMLTDTISNTIGKWNDLGVFFGTAALLSLITVELLSLSRVFKMLAYAALIVSLLLLMVVNFSLVWFVLGLFSLVVLVYLISFRGAEENSSEAAHPLLDASPVIRQNRRIPLPSLLVLLISVAFMLAGNTLGNGISSFFRLSNIEARPSWPATFLVARQTLIEDPLLGAGPNQFVSQWLKFKPAGINDTVFWNANFSYGVGLIPTLLATVGILGLMAWLVFFLSFCYTGFTAILSDIQDKFSQYLIASSFLTSLFLWIFSIIYIPSVTIFALTFLFTGLFIASLLAERFVPTAVISFTDNPRTGFVSVLALVLLLIGSVSLGYFFLQKYVAAVSFQRGLSAANSEGNVDKAEGFIARAAALSPSDLYDRYLAELTLVRMNSLFSSNAGVLSQESVRSQFQTLLGTALNNARQAVARNPKNYENFVELGRVYEAVVPLNITGAYESAKQSYEEALKFNPHSPALMLAMARLEIAKKDNTKAREHIAQALREKRNYTEAIFFLSQIEAQEGNIKAAISSVEVASVLSPDDPAIFFQLGFLRFTDRDFPGAASALERAVALNSSYANAKYFLGLSHEKLGRDAEAIAQFVDLKSTNPDNKEVDLILRNLRAGRSPFSNAAPPVDDKPEMRAKLPVEEESGE